jgi:hypothetical protein
MQTKKTTRRVRLLLENDQTVLVPKWALAMAVGIDQYGNCIIKDTEAPFSGELIGLTYCCSATAKGCDGYVGCRNCYNEVESYLGAPMFDEDIYLRTKAAQEKEFKND